MKMELGGCYYKEIRDERSESSVSRVISSEPNASRRFPVAAFRWETTSSIVWMRELSNAWALISLRRHVLQCSFLVNHPSMIV